ncbi:MAG: hypothetical protein MZV65_42000 [Chromatiales bacterium]|nr:hypothetical protein [Chromatiales bacterium]
MRHLFAVLFDEPHRIGGDGFNAGIFQDGGALGRRQVQQIADQSILFSGD